MLATLTVGVLAAGMLAAGASAQPRPGDILVVDTDASPGSRAVLFQVDPQTGARTVIHDFGGSNPTAVAVEADGGILVTDPDAGTDPSGGASEWGALYRLVPDPGTGELVRTILTDFGVGDSTGRNPRAVTVEADGQILVVNGNGGTANRAVLVRIDPPTGDRRIVTDFGNDQQGPLGIDPRGVAVEADGQILVIDAQAGTSGAGELVRIDPRTGVRTTLSNFGAGANPGSNPSSVAVEASGQILVTDEGHPSTTPLGLLFRVDPRDGSRVVLSNFNSGDDTGREPEGVALEADGQILVVDKHAGPFNRGLLFRVDPAIGAREVVSDFGAGADQGGDPLAVAVMPEAVVPPSQATLTVITEVVNDDGGTASPSEWTVTVTGGNPIPASSQAPPPQARP
jgi:sugar lactone lactonase YvrE